MTQIHVGRYQSSLMVSNEPYHGYKIVFTIQSAPDWARAATDAGSYFVFLPGKGYGEAIYVNNGQVVPEKDVPPAGIVISQENSYDSRSIQQ